MSYELLKSLHIIFIVCWFAGLFYIVRLFIYHREAQEKSQQERDILVPQFQLMESRLWNIITWPSCILSLMFGMGLLRFFMPLGEHPWLHAKLTFVMGLFLYHLYLHRIYKCFQDDKKIHSSLFFRILNEVGTLFLFAIVFLVVFKDTMNSLQGLLYFVLLAIFIGLGIRLAKRLRS